MSLAEEIQVARKKVVTDGYEMSIGEVINLYKNEELIIDPVFQRLYRWDDERKTRFIESLILGIPIPPIFVYQDETGIWELIDGLQRISTVLQLTGDLKGERVADLGVLVLNGTRFLPSLNGKRWRESTAEADDSFSQALQLEIKRARVRVEILKSDSDVSAKYELFQRLNTGGASLSEQEVRNSIAVSLNRNFYDWLIERSKDPHFVMTTDQTDVALNSQAGVELALRFFAFRSVPYQPGMDVHEYLDDALLKLATSNDFNMEAERRIFAKTFQLICDSLGSKAFKRWGGDDFTGKFLMSVFEVLSTGVSYNLIELDALNSQKREEFIRKAARDLWANPEFKQNSGAGIRGTTRLAKLLPIAAGCLRP